MDLGVSGSCSERKRPKRTGKKKKTFRKGKNKKGKLGKKRNDIGQSPKPSSTKNRTIKSCFCTLVSLWNMQRFNGFPPGTEMKDERKMILRDEREREIASE